MEYGLTKAIVNWHQVEKQSSYEQAKQEVLGFLPILEPILERNYY
jgi:hypothetical protein